MQSNINNNLMASPAGRTSSYTPGKKSRKRRLTMLCLILTMMIWLGFDLKRKIRSRISMIPFLRRLWLTSRKRLKPFLRRLLKKSLKTPRHLQKPGKSSPQNNKKTMPSLKTNPQICLPLRLCRLRNPILRFWMFLIKRDLTSSLRRLSKYDNWLHRRFQKSTLFMPDW